MADEIKLVEGHVLRAEPGDVVVITTERHLSQEAADHIRKQAEMIFGSDVKIAVLDAGMKLSILRGLTAEQAAEVVAR